MRKVIFIICFVLHISDNFSFFLVFTTTERKLDVRPKFLLPQEEILTNTIQNFVVEKPVDWTNLKKNVLESGNRIKDFNYDGILLGFCISKKNLEAGRSYINHIYSNNQVPNIATLGRFLLLHFTCNKEKKLNESDEKEIFNMYVKLYYCFDF